MSEIRVISICPFFRYAVGPANLRNPAIPYYTLKEAKKFFVEVTEEIPWESTVLYKRRWFKGLEVIAQSKAVSLEEWVAAEKNRCYKDLKKELNK